MKVDTEIEYALSRVHAHYGRRLTAMHWSRIEASRGLLQYVEAVRSSALSSWVASLPAVQDSHVIERTLRLEWRRYVEAVASWHPPEYQPWLAWLEWLPSLSLLARLGRPERVPSWMLADPLCGPIAPGTLPERRAAVLNDATLAPLEPGIAGRAPMMEVWLAHWRGLAPRSVEPTRRHVAVLLTTIERYEQSLSAAVGHAGASRDELDRRLARLFRAAAGTAVATVSHLLLLALDLQRLRGGLVTRCLFTPAGKAA